MSKIGRELIEAAKEAAAIARGEQEPAGKFIPADVDVRAIRKRLDLSQDDFASQFGFSVNQIRDWEQGRARPLGGMRAYLLIIQHDPESIRRLLSESAIAARKAA